MKVREYMSKEENTSGWFVWILISAVFIPISTFFSAFLIYIFVVLMQDVPVFVLCVFFFSAFCLFLCSYATIN